MPAIATIEHASAVIDPAAIDRRTKNGRPKRVPKAIKYACELIADGEVKTVKAAAERANLSRTHLSRMLSTPHVRAFLARKSSQTIAQATLRASRRLVELIDAESEHVAAKVSDRILTSEGILKSDQASIAVNVDIRAGYVIDLSGQAQAALSSGPVVEHDESSS